MTTDRLWVGLILVALGVFFLLPIVGLGLPFMWHSIMGSHSIIHLAGGAPFACCFPHAVIRQLTQTVIPVLLVGLGVYLVLRTR